MGWESRSSGHAMANGEPLRDRTIRYDPHGDCLCPRCLSGHQQADA